MNSGCSTMGKCQWESMTTILIREKISRGQQMSSTILDIFLLSWILISYFALSLEAPLEQPFLLICFRISKQTKLKVSTKCSFKNRRLNLYDIENHYDDDFTIVHTRTVLNEINIKLLGPQDRLFPWYINTKILKDTEKL